MGTMWSSLFVRFEGSIEWNYLSTILWNHICTWMKDVRLCHQNTQDHRIARGLWFLFFSLEFLYAWMNLIPGFLADRSTLYGIVWYDGMKDPYGKDFDFSCKYADSTKGKQSTINFFWWIESTINHLEFPMLMLH
jgi:hypothetical protein